MFNLIRGRGVESGVSDTGTPQSGASGALQALKANFSRLPEPTDPAYVSARAETLALAEALEGALRKARSADATWEQLAADHAGFTAALSAAYGAGTGAGTGATASAFACASTEAGAAKRSQGESALVADGCSPAHAAAGLAKAAADLAVDPSTGPVERARRKTPPHAAALDMTRRFVAHLRGVLGRHRDVCKAKAELDSCTAKVRALEAKAAGAATPASVGKHREKRDLAERLYRAMVERMVERMRAALDRRANALALVSHAFWLQQARLHSAMGVAQQDVYDAARAAEPLLFAENLVHDLATPSSMFNALDTRARGSGRGGSSGGSSGGIGGTRDPVHRERTGASSQSDSSRYRIAEEDFPRTYGGVQGAPSLDPPAYS